MASEAVEKRLLARCKAFPLLAVSDYLGANSDLAEVEPYAHAARYGLWEDRLLINPEHRWAVLAAGCAEVATPTVLDTQAIETGLSAASDLVVRLIGADAHARTRDAADRIASALRSVGAKVEEGVAPSPATTPALELIFDPGPHTDQLAATADPQDRYAGAVVVLTRTPHEAGFSRHLPRALSAAAVISAAPETHAVFAAAGAPCLWLDLPPVPSSSPPAEWGALIPHDLPTGWSDRPIEVAALGLLTERRAVAWEELAEPVAARKNFIHMPRRGLESRSQGLEGSRMALRRSVYARSKIALHLHAQEPTALDWRTVCDGALANGAVLIAEPGLSHPRFSPDLHFFEEAPRRMPALMDWLLDTHEGRREAMRRRLAALSALARADDLFDVGVRLANFCRATAETAR